ncbi:MAG TPA: DUF695 domain-containing protein [Chryseosolibacter sp.]|nr:DUF695 domain-containing protein [Chryseosolibacter sp.]
MNLLKTIFGTKDDPIKSVEEFWAWFQKNERAFYKVVKQNGDIENDFFNKLSPKLNELKDGFFYLNGMCNDDTAELIITPDGAIKNIVFVEELIHSAPRIDGWRFTALKPALDIKDVNVEMDGCRFHSGNISFYSNDLPGYPDEIDITIVHNDLTNENRSTIVNGTYIFLDNLLGEYNFVTTIDNLAIVRRDEAKKELVPIGKLKEFLIWREKEFVEKYEGVRYHADHAHYAGLEAELENGNPLVAIINTGLLEWDSKASHPWILSIEVKYDGSDNRGMPDEAICRLLDEIETSISDELKDFDGFLRVGRQTANNCREIYFACRDFRKPSKVLHKVKGDYIEQIDMDFDIYKDKYWQSFNRFKRRV